MFTEIKEKTLLSEDLPVTSLGTEFQKIRTCPHCKKEID